MPQRQRKLPLPRRARLHRQHAAARPRRNRHLQLPIPIRLAAREFPVDVDRIVRIAPRLIRRRIRRPRILVRHHILILIRRLDGIFRRVILWRAQHPQLQLRRHALALEFVQLLGGAGFILGPQIGNVNDVPLAQDRRLLALLLELRILREIPQRLLEKSMLVGDARDAIALLYNLVQRHASLRLQIEFTWLPRASAQKPACLC